MEKITIIGLDLAKSVFQVHAITEEGHVAVRRALRRSQVLEFFRRIEPCLVGMEACGSAHYWANAISEFGHTVRLMPPAYVKPYVKRNKTDAADAEAICEAVTRPTMGFVPVKSPDEQAAGMVLKTRELLVRQRSQTANAMRAHLAEFGIIAATGMTSIAKLVAILRDDRDDRDGRLPNSARAALLEMADQIERLTERVEVLDSKITAAVKADDAARRLTSIPGVGPIICSHCSHRGSGSCSLSNRAGLGRLDRHHAKSELQRREGAAWQNLQARQQAATNALDCRCDVDPETGAQRFKAAWLDRIDNGTSAL